MPEEPHFTPEDDEQAGFTDEQAAGLSGASIVVWLTHVDGFGEPVFEVQFHGIVEGVAPDGVALRRTDSGEIEWLPPVADSYERTDPGIYTLHPGGEVVENPDFRCAWTVHAPPADDA
ncbi:MAG: hypothetical protein QOJ57_534 [Thermoleophilaceae bacterium]|nr:hypothetical protein [Thermoleophilaceae bacterium]